MAQDFKKDAKEGMKETQRASDMLMLSLDDDVQTKIRTANKIPAVNKDEDKIKTGVKMPPVDIGQEKTKTGRKMSGDDEQDKIKTGKKIPAPAPRGAEVASAAPEEAEEPMSSETISIKRSSLVEKKERVEIAPKVPEKRVCKITCYKCAQKLDLTELEPFSKVNCPSCNVEIIVPKWFDNYLLEEPGGVGGMAVVYRALDLTLDREVAIKVLNPDVASATERSHLFLHEARTAATVNHYAVLPIYTCGEFEGQPYIVMQFMDGGSLDKKLEENKEQFPINDVIKWIRDVAEGLDNARRHGIIHHDIKPANIMMDKDGNVKIGDFGIAQAMRDSRSETIAKITKLWASPHYVSPEKALDGKEDHTGDIYSLGATFYQLITKHTPFEIDDIDELVRKRIQEDPPNPKKHRADIPQTVSDLIMKMMSRKPDARPTYRDIVNCLNTLIKEHDKRKDAREKHVKKPLPAEKKNGKVFGPKNNGTPLDLPRAKHPLITIGIHVAISVVMLGSAFLIWQSGMLDKYLYKGGKLPKDLVKDATNMFSIGDCKQGGRIAERVLNDGTARVAARKQAGIQYAFAKYLANDPEAGVDASKIYEKLVVVAGINEEDPYLEILRYLGGDTNSPKQLNERVDVEGNRFIAILAAQAIYIRYIYDKNSCVELMSSSNYYLKLVGNAPGEFWGSVWKDRVSLWKEWTEKAKGDSTKLEEAVADYKVDVKEIKPEVKPVTPVTPQPVKPVDNAPVANNVTTTNTVERMKSTFDDLAVTISEDAKNLKVADLTPEWIQERRAFAANRPKPADYTFSMGAFRTYLESIPEDKRVAEESRYKQVSGIKNYIAVLMERNPYDKPLKLKNGRIMTGDIMVNANYISVKNRANKYDRLGWDQFGVEQVSQILDHFGNFRLNASGGATVSKTQQKLEAAEDFLRIGIFCDWYGDYASAVKFAKKAYGTDPRVEDKVKKFLMQ
ncbi:MAG TPA: hypothetical protein DCZ94_19460 [Lentisphaeria bacterium]|nr:MAG: hypothetical protein A2X48_07605 [Lentisphaerae bacterium GWF2_49_21]HBC89122.1 hypothetical protein [Lentisphaeria bacterium]